MSPAVAVVGLVFASAVALGILVLLFRVAATRRNLKGLSATLASSQNKTQDYLQSLTAGLSAVERALAELQRRPVTPPGTTAPAAEFDRIRGALQMVSGQLTELTKAQAERIQALEREVAAMTVSTEARVEELRATLESRLGTQYEEWLRRVAELHAESNESASRALDEANLAVSQLQGLVQDRLSQALAVQHGQMNAVLERLEAYARESTVRYDATDARLQQQLRTMAEENDGKLANVLSSFQRQLERALEGVVNRFAELDWLVRQMSESMVVLSRDIDAQRAGLQAVRDVVAATAAGMEQVAASCGAAVDERLARAAEEQAARAEEAMSVLGAGIAGLRRELAGQWDQTAARLQELGATLERVATQLASRPEQADGAVTSAVVETVVEQLGGRLAEVTDSLSRLGTEQRSKLEALIAGLANLRQDGSEMNRLIEEGLGRLRPEAGAEQNRQYAELMRLVADQSVLVERLATELGRLAEQIGVLPGPGEQPGHRAIAHLVPSPGGNGNEVRWMPIEVVSPLEAYERLVRARTAGDAETVARAGNEMEANILSVAAAMRQKYSPLPGIADVAIMFLPVEGLYAEVLQRPALCRSLHRDYRIIIASPATLDSLLAKERSTDASYPVR
jgi:DNA recombination protein RmuC